MRKLKVLLISAALVASVPFTALAGNVDTFGIGARAVALGGAYTANADGPFAIYYNPAGLTQLKSPVASVGFEVLDPTLKIHDYKAYAVTSATVSTTGSVTPTGYGCVSPCGKSFHDTSPDLVIPAIGFAEPVKGSRFAVGLAMYVPFGLHIKWDHNAAENPGAYNSFESWYYREVVTPTVSYKISDQWSIGFGISIGRSYSGTKRRQYIPETKVPVVVGSSLTYVTVPQEPNAVTVKSSFIDATNYSFNIGVMYKPSDKLSFGLAYRGRTRTHFSGNVRVVSSNPLVKTQETGAHTKIDHPDQIQFGVMYKPTQRLSLEADVEWTHWHLIKSYTVHFNHPLVIGTTVLKSETFERNWKNTTQFRFGVEYKASKLLTLRAGYYYDPSPIPTNTFDLQWPDGNKSSYSVGAGLNFGRLSIDAAVQYVVATSKRYVRGDSVELNSSYGKGGKVYESSNGHIWGYALTLNYKF